MCCVEFCELCVELVVVVVELVVVVVVECEYCEMYVVEMCGVVGL